MIDRKIASNSRLGFIGLGLLGSRIARRLAAAARWRVRKTSTSGAE